jgi:hypothetical protein
VAMRFAPVPARLATRTWPISTGAFTQSPRTISMIVGYQALGYGPVGAHRNERIIPTQNFHACGKDPFWVCNFFPSISLAPRAPVSLNPFDLPILEFHAKKATQRAGDAGEFPDHAGITSTSAWGSFASSAVASGESAISTISAGRKETWFLA